jgi:hypothetical protein
MADYASTNPNTVLLFYENFEEYANASNLNGQGGWVYDPKGSGDEDTWDITDSISDNTNKIFAGDKSVECQDSGTKWQYHSLATATDVVFRVGVWGEFSRTGQVKLLYDDGTYTNYITVGITTGGANGFRVTGTNTGGTLTTSSVNSASNQYHEFIFYVSSANGLSFYSQAGILIFNNSSLPTLTTGYECLNLHTVNACAIGGGHTFYDFIRYYKSYSTPDAFQVI